MGIDFLIDDAQRGAEELEIIAKEFKKPIRKDSKNTKFLKKFVVALYLAGEDKHKKRVEKIKKEAIKKIIEKQFPQKIKKPEERSDFKPSLIKEEIKRELPPPPIPVKLKESHKKFEARENEYPLVVLKHNNKVMASALVNEKYELVEPDLDKADIKILEKLKNVPERMFEKTFKKLCKKFRIKPSENYTDKIKYYLGRELGRIDALLRDSKINLISGDGVEKTVKVVYKGKELPTNINFRGVEEINDIVNRLAKKLGKKASVYSTLEGTLDTGHRVQVMLGSEEITPRFTIEKR